MDVDLEAEKKGRRSSILKPQKPRNPLSTLDFSETNPDNTLARASRRVSFASSNFVKPFAADPEKNTIWDNTYEEEVNHTDSTKSSCDQTYPTKTSDLSMTCMYSNTSEEIYHNENILAPSRPCEYIDAHVAKAQVVSDITNSGESLISLARKLRSKSPTAYYNTSEMMDFTLINNTHSAEKISATKIINKDNSKLQKNIPESSACNGIRNISCSTTKLTESTMEMTSCITDKENVNPLINDLSLITPRRNKLDCSVRSKNFVDKIWEFTEPLERNEKTDYVNRSEDIKFEVTDMGKEKCTNDKSMEIKKCESVMDFSLEFTCMSEGNKNFNSFDGGSEKQNKEGELEGTVFDNSFIKHQIDVNNKKTVYLDDSLNAMEFTNLEKNEECIQNTVNSTINKRKTIIFGEAEGNMELTAISGDDDFTRKEDIEKFKKFPYQLHHRDNTQSELNQNNKTRFLNQSENDVEFTTSSSIPVSRPVYNKGNLNTAELRGLIIPKRKEEMLLEYSEEDMEITKLNAQNASAQERKMDIGLQKSVCLDQSEIGMELTNTLIGKINFAVRPMDVQLDNMKLATVLSNNTVNEGAPVNYEKEETMELTSTIPVNFYELKQSEISMDFTHTLVGKINVAFDSTKGRLENTELNTALPNKTIHENEIVVENKENMMVTHAPNNTDVLKQFGMPLTENLHAQTVGCNIELLNCSNKGNSNKLIREKEVVEFRHDGNLELTSAAPLNPTELKQCDMSLTQNLHTKTVGSNIQFLNKSSKEDSNKMKVDSPAICVSSKNNEIVSNTVSMAKLCISDMNLAPPVKDCKTSSVNKSNGANVILQNNNDRSITPKGSLITESVQNNSMCNAICHEDIKNEASTINIAEGSGDSKRHITNSIDDNIIKKRRIQKLLVRNEECDLGNYLPDTNKTKSINGKFYQPEKETKFTESRSEIGTNLETVPSGSKSINPNLGRTLNHTTTPSTSFHINLSCIEDTQQLIHATFSEPETLKMLNNLKHTESSFSSLYKSDVLQSEVPQNFRAKLSHESGCREISSNEVPNGTVSRAKEKMYVVENVKSTLKDVQIANETHFDKSEGNEDAIFNTINTVNLKNGGSYLLNDITPPKGVANEFDSGSEAKLLNPADFDKKLISEDIKPIERDDSMIDYTLRAQTVINNINLLRYEPVELPDLRISKLIKEFKDNFYTIKDYLVKRQNRVIDLEEYLKHNEEILSSKNEAIICAGEDPTKPSTVGFVARKSLCERVREIAKRTKKYWEFVKMEDDWYYFYTLFGTLPFKVHVHPELGNIYTVTTYSNLSDIVQPICCYQLTLFQHKLKQENLLSVLGLNFDIFTLLDYVYMTMEEIIKFHTEYMNLVRKCGETHHFRMNNDFSITFEILNVKLIICWIITVKLSSTNLFSVTKEDITAVHKVGQNVNEEHIKTIAENTPKGPNFLRNFIENVDEYVYRMGKKIRR